MASDDPLLNDLMGVEDEETPLVEDVVPLRVCHSDGRDGVTELFISKLPKGGGNGATHLLLNGGGRGGKDRGIVNIPPAETDDFYKHLSQDFRQGRMLPISMVRTIVFPFFVDLDLAVPVAVMSDEAKTTLAVVLNAQAKRFFPEDHPELVCVICDKSGDAPVVKPSAREIGVKSATYKHGLHLHWPSVMVRSQEALRMRAAMLAALERENWSKLLGTNAIEWPTVFDDSVYGGAATTDKVSGGLRMVGAPKASKCPECRNMASKVSDCTHCFKRGHIIDPSHYKLFGALLGASPHEQLTRRMKNNHALLLRYTSVRSADPDLHTISEGWKPYVGCPAPPAAGGAGGRKRKASSAESIEKKFSKPAIQDPDVENTVRQCATILSEHYRNTTFNIRFDGKNTYKVLFRGDGSNFCLNMNDFHKSNNVYMIIKAGIKKEAVAYMCCFCTCKTTERRFSGMCCDFKSRSISLGKKEYGIMFNGGSTTEQIVKQQIEKWKNM